MDATEASAWRASKQVVALNARFADDDVCHGLVAAFDKPVFMIYWLRDSMLSVPGAIYTGGIAAEVALKNAGVTLAFQIERDAEAQGVYPDGRVRTGHYSDGPALGVVAQAYGWALQGQSWLDNFYPTTQALMQYLLGLDGYEGDPLDGMIRASQGDWKDASSMGIYRRCGSSYFTNVCYLYALRHAVAMADAASDPQQAAVWRDLYQKGNVALNQSVENGGLWQPERGHYADWTQVDGKRWWVFPDEQAKVTVYPAFETVGHGIAMATGLIPQAYQSSVLQNIQDYGLLDPTPAPAQYPFYAMLEGHEWQHLPEGMTTSNPWMLKTLNPNIPDWLEYDWLLAWKGWPGNHNWGGRWMFAGSWLVLGLWHDYDLDAARRGRRNLERSLLRARHPARCLEVESYGAVSRAETGSYTDPSGYYQLWSGAVYLQMVVEGAYGARPIPGGAEINLLRCATGDGLQNLPIAGGSLTFQRDAEAHYQITLATDQPGVLRLKLPWDAKIDGADGTEHDGDWLRVSYKPHSTMTIYQSSQPDF